MAFTFTTTIKGATTNSYLTVQESTDFAAGHQDGASWTVVVATQERYLVAATQRIDTELFSGAKTTDIQALLWPRTGILDRDGNSFNEDIYPPELKRAVFELALTYSITQPIDLNEAQYLQSKSESLDGLGSSSVTYKNNFKSGQLPDEVKRLLKLVAWSSTQIKVVR